MEFAQKTNERLSSSKVAEREECEIMTPKNMIALQIYTKSYSL